MQRNSEFEKKKEPKKMKKIKQPDKIKKHQICKKT